MRKNLPVNSKRRGQASIQTWHMKDKAAARKTGRNRDEHASRSEERRVGKECRWTGDWSSDVCSSDLRSRDTPVGAAPATGTPGIPFDRHIRRFRTCEKTSQ